MIERGSYRSNYESLADDSDFQELSPLAQAVFHTIKLKVGPYGIGVFYPSVLQEYHRRASEPELAGALAELEATKPSGAESWLTHQANVWWIRNALRFDPNMSMENKNHRKGALRHARALPQKSIGQRFVEYYELEAARIPSEGDPDPIPNPRVISERERESERERDKPTTPTPAADANPEKGERTASEISIATALERRSDREALRKVLAAAGPEAWTWLEEMAAALSDVTGEYKHVTPRTLGNAIRSFVANGKCREKPPKFTLFQGYLRNEGRPRQPRRPRRREGSAETGDYTPPRATVDVEPEGPIVWAR